MIEDVQTKTVIKFFIIQYNWKETIAYDEVKDCINKKCWEKLSGKKLKTNIETTTSNVLFLPNNKK